MFKLDRKNMLLPLIILPTVIVAAKTNTFSTPANRTGQQENEVPTVPLKQLEKHGDPFGLPKMLRNLPSFPKNRLELREVQKPAKNANLPVIARHHNEIPAMNMFPGFLDDFMFDTLFDLDDMASNQKVKIVPVDFLDTNPDNPIKKPVAKTTSTHKTTLKPGSKSKEDKTTNKPGVARQNNEASRTTGKPRNLPSKPDKTGGKPAGKSNITVDTVDGNTVDETGDVTDTKSEATEKSDGNDVDKTGNKMVVQSGSKTTNKTRNTLVSGEKAMNETADKSADETGNQTVQASGEKFLNKTVAIKPIDKNTNKTGGKTTGKKGKHIRVKRFNPSELFQEMDNIFRAENTDLFDEPEDSSTTLNVSTLNSSNFSEALPSIRIRIFQVRQEEPSSFRFSPLGFRGDLNSNGFISKTYEERLDNSSDICRFKTQDSFTEAPPSFVRAVFWFLGFIAGFYLLPIVRKMCCSEPQRVKNFQTGKILNPVFVSTQGSTV